MQRRTMICSGAWLLTAPLLGHAQGTERTVRIGLLYGDAPLPHEEQELLAGLREQGLVEGRNLVIERRYGEGRLQLVPGYARELAAMQLDAVVTTCSQTTLVAQKVLGATPIVMAAVADPVGQQIISSLARPGANTTGLSSQAEDIMPKMLGLFAQVLPSPTTVAVLVDASSSVHPRMWRALGPLAQRLNITLVKVEAGRRPGDVDIPTAFEAAVRARAGGIFVLPDEPFFLMARGQIVALAANHRLPAFYGLREFVDDGGLMSYGESMRRAYRGVGSYVHKVVGGANPGHMPVTQPTRFELVINMKTATSLGVTVPQGMLLSADSVIQ